MKEINENHIVEQLTTQIKHRIDLETTQQIAINTVESVGNQIVLTKDIMSNMFGALMHICRYRGDNNIICCHDDNEIDDGDLKCKLEHCPRMVQKLEMEGKIKNVMQDLLDNVDDIETEETITLNNLITLSDKTRNIRY